MIVSVVGSAPGAGKSTLAAALAGELAGRGLRVDLFREEEIRTRPAFAGVAAELRAGGEVALPTLRAGVAAWAAAVDADVVVADALVPVVPSMLVWGHSEDAVAAFHADLAGLVDPVVLYVDADVDAALARAQRREGPAWLPWPVHVLPAGPPADLLRAALAVLDPLLPARP